MTSKENCALAGLLLWVIGSCSHIYAQSGSSLPVYSVVASGASPRQAAILGDALGIPATSLVVCNGIVAYKNPATFLAPPSVPVTDPALTSNLLAQTVNKVPGIPIRVEAVDFAGLQAIQVTSSNNAVTLTTRALTSSGLTPTESTQIVTHTAITIVYTNDQAQLLSVSNVLDTQINYQLSLGGVPLIGPGAQVQVTYGTNRTPTRVLYSARQLTPGPPVTLLSAAEASNRVANVFPPGSQISPQLVYYAPPLSLTTVSNIIPWYLCGGSCHVTDDASGLVFNINTSPVLIPATDDPRFVPAVQFSANFDPAGNQVLGNAIATGGSPPYTYLWSGSGTSLSGLNGPRTAYVPQIQLTPLLLSTVSGFADGSVRLQWSDPSGLLQLESAPITNPESWSPVAGLVTGNGVSTLPVNPGSSPGMLYRLRLSTQSIPTSERMSVEVIDANGVSVKVTHSLPVQALPYMPPLQNINPLLMGWGTEGPYDHDFLSGDCDSWRKSMKNDPVFGTEHFYRGEFVAAATDFFDAPYGNNDLIVDGADITFYAGHGSPNTFTFTDDVNNPGKPTSRVWSSQPYHFWGNRDQSWFCLLSCEVLQQFDANAVLAFARWGQAFDGLHLMLGFSSLAYAGGVTGPLGAGFPEEFVKYMAGTGRYSYPVPIMSAWFDAAMTTGPMWGSDLGRTGNPAVLGPIAAGGIWDVNDYWWGKGPVGPRIRAPQIRGWYYLTQTN